MIPLLESWNNFFKYDSETKAQAFQKFPWLEKSSGDDDKEIVYMINNHSDIVQQFIDLKDEKGKPVFFHPQLVRNILYTSSYFIEKHPDIIKATLSDPEAMDLVRSANRRDISFCELVENPLPSTVKINPQAFDFKPKKEVTTEDILWATKSPSRFYMYVQLYDDPRPDYEELVNLVIKTKDTNGNPLLNDRAASETLYSASNLNQSKKFKAVLSDPKAVAVIADNPYFNERGKTVHNLVEHPLDSTMEKNPFMRSMDYINKSILKSMGMFVNPAQEKHTKELLEKHSHTVYFLSEELPKLDGGDLLDKSQIAATLLYCQEILETKPDILIGILKDPEARKQLKNEDAKSRAYALKKMCNNPLPSSVKANPAAFQEERKTDKKYNELKALLAKGKGY